MLYSHTNISRVFIKSRRYTALWIKVLHTVSKCNLLSFVYCKLNDLFITRCPWQPGSPSAGNWVNARSFALWVCLLFHLPSNRKWHTADLFTMLQLCPFSLPPFFLILFHNRLLFMLRSKRLFIALVYWEEVSIAASLSPNPHAFLCESYKWPIQVYRPFQK